MFNSRRITFRTLPKHVWSSCNRETEGRLRKRVVLANVPSFRCSFRGNMRTYPRSGFRSVGTSECTLVPVFVPGEHPPKPPFWKATLLSTHESFRHARYCEGNELLLCGAGASFYNNRGLRAKPSSMRKCCTPKTPGARRTGYFGGDPESHLLVTFELLFSMLNMTGRPGHRTMEMNGGSSAPYLVRTPCVPLFVLCFMGVETEGLLDYQGGWGSFPLYGGTFARSYSVSIFKIQELSGIPACENPPD